MVKEKETHVYTLINKNNEIVYIGTSTDPDRRGQEHRRNGKKFDTVQRISTHKNEELAKKKERKMLDQFYKNHGKHPLYNKDPSG